MASETTNRTAKALRLAEAIRGLDAWVGAGESMVDQVAKMPATWWASIAELAGTNPPSVQTVDVVVQVLRSEVRQPDPFASFDLDKAGLR